MTLKMKRVKYDPKICHWRLHGLPSIMDKSINFCLNNKCSLPDEVEEVESLAMTVTGRLPHDSC